MKLTDKIIENLEFKQKKNNSLVSSIEKIKYHDLLTISTIVDKPTFLNEFSSGWNSIHYAVLNSPEVLYFISNLYIKNNCDLNQPVQRGKNSTPINSHTVDIAIHNQKLEQFLILKHFNINQSKNISFYLHNYSRTYQKEENFEELNLPFEHSLVNLFMFSSEFKGINLLEKTFNYEEKEQVIDEFLTNHQFIVNNYLESKIFRNYDNFFEKIILDKDKLDINVFDFFAVILLKHFDLKNLFMDSSVFNQFEKMYKDNPSGLFQDLNDSQYKQSLIILFKEINNLDITKGHNKQLKNFMDKYHIDKLLFSVKLEEKLVVKNISTKTFKI